MSVWRERVWVADDGKFIRQDEAEARFGDSVGPRIIELVRDAPRCSVLDPVSDVDVPVHYERKVYRLQRIAFHTRNEFEGQEKQLPFSDAAMAEIVAFMRSFG